MRLRLEFAVPGTLIVALACSSKVDSSSKFDGGSGSAPSASMGGGGTSAGGAGSGGLGAASGGTGAVAGASSGGSAGTGGGVDTGGASATGGAPGSGGSGTGDAGSSVALAPTTGALLGLYYGDTGIPGTNAKLGRTVPIHLVYYAWDDDWTTGDTKTDLAAARIPLVNWEPNGIDFNDIVSGSLDATIQARATESKALKQPFFLDFAAEMNGDEAWSGNDPTLYVAAYRHIHDQFVAAGATNVVWAWCPNVADTDGTNKTTMAYYPGDTYVDWTGVDGYNWGTTGGDGWQSFHDVFAGIYPLLAAKGKPILIGEMASAEAGGDKAAFIQGIIPTLKADFPLIKGLVWFDVNKETDWRISSSRPSEQAFIRMALDPYFNP